jgi:mRNA interferase RelE/StbE
MAYEIRMASTAVRDLAAIPPRYAAAILEFIYTVLPENPRRVGKPLARDLEGSHSARRGDYRVIYQIHEAAGDVLIIRVSHRATIYRPR